VIAPMTSLTILVAVEYTFTAGAGEGGRFAAVGTDCGYIRCEHVGRLGMNNVMSQVIDRAVIMTGWLPTIFLNSIQ
jgi:hypothetical protein